MHFELNKSREDVSTFGFLRKVFKNFIPIFRELEKAESITLIALLDVVRKNDLEKLNLLLKNISKNPERTKLISDFKVVLHQTAALNHIECARMLIENGFSLLERDEFNCTPFSIAALYGHLEIVYYFATQLTPDNLIEQSIEALSYAAFMVGAYVNLFINLSLFNYWYLSHRNICL